MLVNGIPIIIGWKSKNEIKQENIYSNIDILISNIDILISWWSIQVLSSKSQLIRQGLFCVNHWFG